MKFKKGDKVVFRPHRARYNPIEQGFENKCGVVMDESDLPNVLMISRWQPDFVLTAHQDDLVKI